VLQKEEAVAEGKLTAFTPFVIAVYAVESDKMAQRVLPNDCNKNNINKK